MKTVKRLLSYMKYDKGKFVIGFTLLITAVITDLYAPIVAQQLIDDVITPSAASGQLLTDLLVRLLGLYALLIGVTALLRYLSFLILTKTANKIVKIIRDQAYRHLQKLPIRYFDNLPAGKVVSQITNDTEVLRQQFYVVTISNVMLNVIYVIGTYIAITRLHVGLGLSLLVLLPLMYIWHKYYSKYAGRFSRKERELNSDINGKINESVQGMSIIQAFQQEEKVSEEFNTINQAWFEVERKYVLLDSAAQFTLGGLLRHVTLMFVMLFFGSQYLDGILGISIGTLYVFGDYVTRLYDPIQGIIQQMSFVQQAIAAGERVFTLVDTPAEEDASGKLDLTVGKVEFDQVSFGYKEETKVLKDISFTANSGETVALVGHTGSGKSSIMNLLFRFYDPDQGEIRIDGQNTKLASRKSVRQGMGIVLQDPFLFTGTIESNITLENPTITKEMAHSALEKVGGDQMLLHFEKGLDEPVVEKGSTLSSGQRQLISFARALAYDPKILILDEATSSIDTETEEIIQHAMDVLKEGRTTFIIAHRLSTIQHADQILVLDNGEIVERGNHQELLLLDGKYAEMYRMQKKSIAEAM
ncbi:ABC transporter ATP-binding protein [Jeotgalibaca sp. PTS2502]|uniref:ABC transporter ATP-binding protein/permease n=1 Tax=Candidatus Jeotgalibaca merdavium TaxID=2838627 RepID=A0A9D2I1S8_9LACT|nr:ABC transporter ATP-binding protein [Jeotgalibaca sp. PTS2502]APZ50057.1 ABC transporter ATP-binding protein [Jeotgalibaca sp. PTS2502]HJA90677.1 ABC transporter ATP-binding protein/permease [Candidatus Jeotgalibaca merdavium]